MHSPLGETTEDAPGTRQGRVRDASVRFRKSFRVGRIGGRFSYAKVPYCIGRVRRGAARCAKGRARRRVHRR
eukprot:gene13685-biopygen6530